jgi:hypothetical protein
VKRRRAEIPSIPIKTMRFGRHQSRFAPTPYQQRPFELSRELNHATAIKVNHGHCCDNNQSPAGPINLHLRALFLRRGGTSFGDIFTHPSTGRPLSLARNVRAINNLQQADERRKARTNACDPLCWMAITRISLTPRDEFLLDDEQSHPLCHSLHQHPLL